MASWLESQSSRRPEKEPPAVTTAPAAPLVWVHLGDGAARFLACAKCSGGLGTDAYLREFLYAASCAPRCARCGFAPPGWLEARRRQLAEERAWRVELNTRGLSAFARFAEDARG